MRWRQPGLLKRVLKTKRTSDQKPDVVLRPFGLDIQLPMIDHRTIRVQDISRKISPEIHIPCDFFPAHARNVRFQSIHTPIPADSASKGQGTGFLWHKRRKSEAYWEGSTRRLALDVRWGEAAGLRGEGVGAGGEAEE